MSFDDFFEKELRAENWTQTVALHTPTFDATIDENGVLWLRGAALAEGFSVPALLALARFLADHVTLPSVEPPYDFADFHATPVEIAEAEGEGLALAQAERWMAEDNYEECTEEARQGQDMKENQESGNE